MGCQPTCDVTYIRTVVVVVGIEYYYVDNYPDDRPCIEMTLWVTPHSTELVTSFSVLSVFEHVSKALSMVPPRVCWRGGGGGGGAAGLLNKGVGGGDKLSELCVLEHQLCNLHRSS